MPHWFWLSSFEHNFLDSQVLLGFGQQNLKYCLSGRQVDKKMFLFRFIFQIISSLLQTMGTRLCLIWVCLIWFDRKKTMSQYQCCLQNFLSQSKTSDWILILTTGANLSVWSLANVSNALAIFFYTSLTEQRKSPFNSGDLMHIYTVCCWTREFCRSQSDFMETKCNLFPGFLQGDEDHYREPRFTSKEVYD